MVEISNQTKPLAKETLSPEGCPKGLEYYKHFLSQAEQAQLLQRIDAEPWEEAGNSPLLSGSSRRLRFAARCRLTCWTYGWLVASVGVEPGYRGKAENR